MNKTKNVSLSTWLRIGTRRMAAVHAFLIIAYVLQTVVMDAWHVIVPQVVLERWVAASILLIIVGGVWYLAHNVNNDVATCKRLLFTLITADVAFAAYNVFIQRGMASKSVLLFAIPLIVSAVLLSRAATIFTAALCTAGYIIATVSYFVLNFNEGYKTELYAEVGFYSAVFFCLALLLSVVVRFGGNATDA